MDPSNYIKYKISISLAIDNNLIHFFDVSNFFEVIWGQERTYSRIRKVGPHNIVVYKTNLTHKSTRKNLRVT